jgi:putative acetyltransferase
MAWTLRSAVHGDRPEVLALVAAAFTSPDYDPTDEVDIVARTWELGACPPDFEIVAEAGAVIGHVMAATGDLSGRPAIGVAPLAVAPGHQRQGVGSALVTEVLRRVGAAGWPFVLLLGDPAYYGRFGFEPADSLGISYGPAGAGNPHFMVRCLTPLADDTGGEFRYCWEVEPPPSP